MSTPFYYRNEQLGSIELETDQWNAKADKCRYLSFSILLQIDHSELFIASPAALKYFHLRKVNKENITSKCQGEKMEWSQ